jgi:hypothetical protein
MAPMFPDEPPEHINWKAFPLVALLFAALVVVLFGGLRLAQTTGILPSPHPLVAPYQHLVDGGGAVFHKGAAHTPVTWKEGKHLLVVYGDDGWTAVFETGAACAATATYLTNAPTGLVDKASCHPKSI